MLEFKTEVLKHTQKGAKSMVVEKPIPGYFGYMATEEGGIVQLADWTSELKDKVIKPHKVKNGSWHVNLIVFSPDHSRLARPTKSTVARLVALAFHGLPPSDKAIAKHKDGNRKNNRPKNVYWFDPAPVAYVQSPGVTEKPIPGLRGYWASSSGQIVQMPAQVVVAPRNGAVSLRIDGKVANRSLAHLVALAFVGKPPEGFGPKQVYVKHLDGDKTNNAASNLYWRTPETKGQ